METWHAPYQKHGKAFFIKKGGVRNLFSGGVPLAASESGGVVVHIPLKKRYGTFWGNYRCPCAGVAWGVQAIFGCGAARRASVAVVPSTALPIAARPDGTLPPCIGWHGTTCPDSIPPPLPA